MVQTMRAGRWLTAIALLAMAACSFAQTPDSTTDTQSTSTDTQSSPPANTQDGSPNAQAKPATKPQPKDADKPKVKEAYKPLLHGQLVVWMVEPSGPGPAIVNAATPQRAPITYREATPSTLGQNASTYGTDASKYGVDADSRTIARVPNNSGPDADTDAAAKAGYSEQTSGSFGQVASNVGTAASDHGQTAGSLGVVASNYGVDSSNYGIDASNFGHSLSDLAGAGELKPAPVSLSFTDQLQASLANRFPNLKVQYLDVGSNDVKTRLRAAGSKDYPDVIILDGFATTWPGLPQDVRDALLHYEGPTPSAKDRREGRLPPVWYVTRHASHASEAHALAAYLDDEVHPIATGQQ
jgi:hypothetical protein